MNPRPDRFSSASRVDNRTAFIREPYPNAAPSFSYAVPLAFTAPLIRIELGPEHLRAIEDLASEEGRRVDEVKKLYAIALHDLRSGARIQDYLIVLTCKKVRDALRRSRNCLQPESFHGALPERGTAFTLPGSVEAT